jgi:hypothetical protein
MSLGRPGVYIQESLTALPTATADSGAALAVFCGTASFGPSTPTLVTSWSQFASLYNGFGSGGDLLPFAVYSYFANGGNGCYVIRGVASDAVAAHITLNDTQGTPAQLATITAKSVGAFGNNIFLTVTANGTSGFFDLSVALGTTSNVVERYVAVTFNPSDPRNIVALVNSPITGSQVISIAYVSAVTPWTTAQTPAVQANTPLASGADGTAGNINLVTAAQQLAVVQGIFNLNLPGVSAAATINSLTSWAAAQGNVFMVVDAPQASTTYAATVAAYAALAPNAGSGTPWTQTSYAAVYGPWLLTNDPSSLAVGAVRTLPPGGAVLGQYASTDTATGTYQTPAGISTALAGVVGVDTVFQAADLDSLNTAGINIIRQVPQYGYCIMGVRTLNYGMPSRYISIRRTLMYVENLLKRGLQFAVAEPNNYILWNKISSTVNQQLSALMQAGYFASTQASTAYWVVCDSTNNTPATSSVGQVNVSVGVALAAPAEYVVISIGLFDSTTQVASNLP